MKCFWKPVVFGVVLFVALVMAPSRAAEKAVAVRSRTAEGRASAEGRLRTDIQILASDEFEGRGPTTQGINKAADYIAVQFKKAGLKPGGMAGTYFQHFTIPGARLLAPATLKLRGPLGQEVVLKQGVQFHPLGLSHPGGLNDVELVFAGYGMTGSKNFKYDDYEDVDVGGKVVVVLRDTPCMTNSQISIDGQQRRQHGSLTEKMTKAEKKGALGILFVNDYDTAKDGDDLMDFNFLAAARSPVNLPALHLRRSVLEAMLQSSSGRSLADIESAIDRDLKPQSVALKGWRVSFEVKVKRDTLDLKNVIGVLEGKGPLANETVVIGGPHYDHLGYGGSSSLGRLKKMAIHNGADDNGSGTSSIIELARRFADDPDRQGRRLVFMAFSGEEMGMLGSAHYCKAPIYDLEKTVAMVNLDMVGRVQNNKLVVDGTASAKGFKELVDKLNAPHGFAITNSKGIMPNSDHASFYAKKVPVIFFFTGDHPDYHRPSDDVERINFEGMRKVVEMAEDTIAHFATVKERPEYIKVETSPRPASGIRLGIKPDYADGADGVLVGGVTDGLPAAKAGIKEGDRIVEMNGKQVKNLEAYMVMMQAVKRGDTLEVGIMREKKKELVKIKID